VTAPDLIGLFIEPLERSEIPYMITGGVASVIYGDPRFTRDIDIVLELRHSNIPRLASVFEGGDFYVPPREVLEEEAARSRGGHFNLIHRETALRADVYLAGDDPLHGWAFSRRQRLQVEAIAIWVAPIEYVIVRKLEYYRASGSDRHLRDVAMMFRISGELVDPQALEGWVRELGLQEIAGAARAYRPSET
jgi:hypothetical protein